MKKALPYIFALASANLWADDAMVLPEHVWRMTNFYSHTNATESYDQNGKKVKMGKQIGTSVKALDSAVAPYLSTSAASNPQVEPELKIDRYDLGIEYGLTDKLSGQVQVPFFLNGKVIAHPNSDMLTSLNHFTLAGYSYNGKLGELFNKYTRDGKMQSQMGDTTIGFKYQWLNTGTTNWGHEAKLFRSCLALGAKAPTGSISSPDSNDIYSTTANNTKAWIFGARTYWDYYPTKWIQANFYSEHEYRMSGDRKYLATDSINATYEVVDTKYRSGVFHHLEFDVHFVPEFNEKTILDSGFMLAGNFTNKGKFTDIKSSYVGSANQEEHSSYHIHATPYLGVYSSAFLIPFRFKMGKMIPIDGKNISANTETFFASLYLYAKFW